MTHAPVATLTLPDGSNQTITATDSNASSHCYSYRIPWTYGMQLGLYTLQLDHPDGQLTHTWGIDYPFCRTSILNDNLQWLMGFAPGEQLTVVFFASINSDQPVFAATRSVQADDQGVLALDIKVARSAPFTREDLVMAVIGPQREIYYPTFGGLDISPFLDLGYSLPSAPIPKPLYLTYTLKGSPIAPGFSACDGEFDSFVIATPQQGNVSPICRRQQPDPSRPDHCRSARPGARKPPGDDQWPGVGLETSVDRRRNPGLERQPGFHRNLYATGSRRSCRSRRSRLSTTRKN